MTEDSKENSNTLSEAVAIAETQEVAEQPEPRVDAAYTLVARDPQQLAAAQAHLVEFCNLKIADVEVEETELREAIEQHQKRKWSTKALMTQLNRIPERKDFYERMLVALRAGYYLIPDFPADVIAIRVKKGHVPQRHRVASSYAEAAALVESPYQSEGLRKGVGEYVNPIPKPHFERSENNGRGGMSFYAASDEWKKMVFPYAMAVPQIVGAAEQAMALNVFDEIGINPPRPAAKAVAAVPVRDPIMIGRIVRPWAYSYSPNRAVNFFIAWWLDPTTL